MKIVLAEDRGGKLLGERAFTSDAVLVGRDPAVCHFFFSQDKWPMVSRRHAEFRLADGRCVVTDANSRFGTYVNGQKLSGPVEVRVGSHIQLGAEGPILRVVSIEHDVAAPRPAPEQKPTQVDHLATVHDSSPAASPPKSVTPSPQSARPSSEPAHLELIDPQSSGTRQFPLDKDVVRLGRDPEGEVVIDAAAAVVSRRHAEISRVDGQFAVADQKSFNGTLVNGQRITGVTQLFDKDQIQLGTGGPVLRLTDPAHPAPARRAAQADAAVDAPRIPSEVAQIAAMGRRQTIVSTS